MHGIVVQFRGGTHVLWRARRCIRDTSWMEHLDVKRPMSLAGWTSLPNWFQFTWFLAFTSFRAEEHARDERYFTQDFHYRQSDRGMLWCYFSVARPVYIYHSTGRLLGAAWTQSSIFPIFYNWHRVLTSGCWKIGLLLLELTMCSKLVSHLSKRW